jgi:hypothetical protein
MSDLKAYKATINGVDHTFQLSDEDATKRGLDPAKDSVESVELATSPLDFGTPTTDGEQVEENVAADLGAKSKTVPNKSRTSTTK